MSKAKVPTLPPGSNRSAIIAFRDQVRTFARREFERGATPEQVYEAVAPNGQLWALKNSIDAEYLDYLGVPRKNARMSATLAGMLSYFVLSGFSPPWSPFFHYGVPICVALVFARWVEVKVTGRLRKIYERHKAAAT